MARVVKKNLDSESQTIVLGKKNQPEEKPTAKAEIEVVAKEVKKEATKEVKKEAKKTVTKAVVKKPTEAVTKEPTPEFVKTLRGEAKPGSLIYRSFEHTERVARFAATLFDDLGTLHGLDSVWRRRLLWAALLHDVGLVEGEKGHHKVSKKMILKDQSYPLSAIDRPFVALLARFHRKSIPTVKDRELMSLPREDRKKFLDVLSILRFCDGLDREWSAAVTGLTVRREKNALLFTLEGNGKLKNAFACAKRKANRLLGYKPKWEKKKGTESDKKESLALKSTEHCPQKDAKKKTVQKPVKNKK